MLVSFEKGRPTLFSFNGSGVTSPVVGDYSGCKVWVLSRAVL